MSHSAFARTSVNLACPACQCTLPGDAAAEGPERLYPCPACLNVVYVEDDENGRVVRIIQDVPRIENLAPEGSVMKGVLGHLPAALDALPVLPQVPLLVFQSMHDPLTSMSDLAEIIDEDAAIALKVLRISNSVLYAGTHEIKDLHVACARLGMKTVANVVHTVSQQNVYRTDNPAFREAMTQLWQHAVATAHSAEAIANAVSPGRFQGAFIAGLVHDIGKLVLLDILSRRYKGRLGQLRDSQDLLRKVLRHFHPYVGVHVVQHWRMPPEFTFSTFCCDAPGRTPSEAWKPLAHIVSLASTVAESFGYGFVERLPFIDDHPSIAALGISPEKIRARLEPLAEELQTTLEVYSKMI